MRYLTIAVAATAAMAFASVATACPYMNQSVKAPQEIVQSTIPATTTTTTTQTDKKG